jgi:hypothetical protein
MSGRLVEAWDYTWAELWQPLANVEDAPADLYMQIYRELANALKQPQEPKSQDKDEWARYETDQKYRFDADSAAASDPDAAAEQFNLWMPQDFKGDHALARAFEAVFEVLDELDTPGLAREFYDLTSKFLRCHNIRYRLVEPYQLWTHVSGWFSGIISHVERFIAADAGLQVLLRDFDRSLNQASRSHVDTDYKNCILRAVILMEGIAGRMPGAAGGTFDELTKSLGKAWPHAAVLKGFCNLYGFCSDYPGIRHGKGTEGVIRELTAADAVVTALLFLSSAGYIAPKLDLAEIVG